MNGKPHSPENRIPPDSREPALPETATRLQESYSTPLKRTIHIPSGTHILRCINIQPRDWETFLGRGKSNLQENCIPSNCRKPALPKIATRLRGLKTPHLLAATHLQNRATSLRWINMQTRGFEAGKRGWKMQTKRTGIFVAHCGFSETLYPCGFGGGGKYVRHILK